MKHSILALALLCTGCADMTPQQQRYTAIAVSVVATGILISHQHNNGNDAPVQDEITRPKIICTSFNCK